MEHREEMNCGGDLCKEMLDVGDGQIAARKQQPRDDGWYTYDWMYTFSDTLLLLTCKKTDVIVQISTSVFLYQHFQRRVNIMYSVSAICRRYVRILEKLLDQDDEFKLKYNNIRDEKTNLTCDI